MVIFLYTKIFFVKKNFWTISDARGDHSSRRIETGSARSRWSVLQPRNRTSTIAKLKEPRRRRDFSMVHPGDETQSKSAPTDTKRNTRLAIAVASILIGCVYGTRPLVALQAHDWGASAFDVGLLTSAFSLLPAALIIPLSHLTRSLTLRLRVLTFSGLASVGLMIPFLVPDITGLYLSQLLTGMCFSGVLVFTLALIEENSTDSTRDHNISRYMVTASISTFLGPSIGGLIGSEFGYGYAFAAAAVVGLAVSTLCLPIKPSTQDRAEGHEGPTSALDLLKRPRLRRALYISALVLMAKDMYVAYFPLIGQELGMSAATIGFIISINSLAGIFIRWMMPVMIARMGLDFVLASSFAVSGVLFVLVPVFSQTSALIAVSFLLGLGLGIGQPISISTTLAALTKDQLPTGLGLRIMANRVTQVTAPFAFGGMAQLAGVGSIFWGIGFIFLLGAWKASRQPRFPASLDRDDLER
ncbi:MFS transporter [Hoeflea sp.]|uniref:MFS transporter n=1 Tax=Hoeflea sp. TaxID=1940281 RepID=UPI003A9149E7